MGEDSSAKRLLEAFKEKARSATDQVELIKVLRSNSFRIGNSHVLVRVAADTGKYFFGLNYINAEEVANLDNAYIAFVCGDVNNTLLVPMAVMMKHLPQISHDRNGEYKINITRELELTLKGRGNRLSLEPFLNQWESLLGGAAKLPPGTNAAEESFHAVIQGRLLDIGNRRGFETYSPNRAKTFNSKPLGEIAQGDRGFRFGGLPAVGWRTTRTALRARLRLGRSVAEDLAEANNVTRTVETQPGAITHGGMGRSAHLDSIVLSSVSDDGQAAELCAPSRVGEQAGKYHFWPAPPLVRLYSGTPR